jgi:hypothetical protein
MSLIAKAPLSKMLCCNTTFADGQFKVERFDGCRVIQVVSQQQIEEYCSSASEHCSFVMRQVIPKQAQKGKTLFYIGVTFLFFFCSFLILSGYWLDIPWLSVVSIFIFVLGIGCCYEILNTRARKIFEVLQGFIEINDFLTSKGIQVKAGPFGTYIEFSLIPEKSLS